MFEKESKQSADLLGRTNRLVEGTIIKGDIVSQGDFRLDGELVGNFTSKGKIVIGQAGIVRGDIVCQNADIEGTFEGKIKVTDILNVKAKAKIQGEVLVGKLSVEPGASFTATCSMISDQKPVNPINGSETKLKESK